MRIGFLVGIERGTNGVPWWLHRGRRSILAEVAVERLGRPPMIPNIDDRRTGNPCWLMQRHPARAGEASFDQPGVAATSAPDERPWTFSRSPARTPLSATPCPASQRLRLT